MGTFTPFAAEQQNEDANAFGAYTPPAGAESDDSHWYSGLATAPVKGVLAAGGDIVSGAAKVMTLADRPSEIGAALSQSRFGGVEMPKTPVEEETDPAAKAAAQDRATRLWRDMTTMDPHTTGVAANVIHGIAKVGSEALTIGPWLTGLVNANSRYDDLTEAGVDKSTALKVSGLDGAMTAAGLKTSYLAGGGSTWITRLATGAAANTAFGAAGREADHVLLQRNGYTAMADQQKALDATDITTDAVLGAFFGGFHQFTHPAAEALRENVTKGVESQNVGSDVRDAAMAANLAKGDREAAPGVPVDLPAAATHAARMQEANAAFGRGEMPDVAHVGEPEAAYIPRETADPYEEYTRESMNELAKEFGLQDVLTGLRRSELELLKRQAAEATPSVSEPDNPPRALQPGSVPVASPESIGRMFKVPEEGEAVSRPPPKAGGEPSAPAEPFVPERGAPVEAKAGEEPTKRISAVKDIVEEKPGLRTTEGRAADAHERAVTAESEAQSKIPKLMDTLTACAARH